MSKTIRNESLGVAAILVAFVVLYALVAGVHDIDALRSDLGDLIPAAQAALVSALLGMGLALLPVHSNHPGRVAPGV